MDNSHQVAEQVGIFGAIATFLLGLFGIHRSTQNRVHARLEELAAKKADRTEVEALGDRLLGEIHTESQKAENRHNILLSHMLKDKS